MATHQPAAVVVGLSIQVVLLVVQAVEQVEFPQQGEQELAVRETKAATEMLYRIPFREEEEVKRQPEVMQIQAH
jgi:hypothetical protein